MNTTKQLTLALAFTLGFLAALKHGVAEDLGTFHEVSFNCSDGGRVYANLYGAGEHCVVLAHGAVFDKESWTQQSKRLAEEGFRVLAIDFRGYGKSRPGTQRGALYLDVLAAVRYLHAQGAKSVSVIGGSMGGGAAAQASVESGEGEIDNLILLAHAPIARPQELKGRKLFIVSKADALAASIRKQHAAAPETKKLVVLNAAAHAQHLFRTDHADTVMDQIVSWLKIREPKEQQ